MNDDAKARLEGILETYDDKLAEADRIGAADRAAQAEFPARFAKLRAETLRPALQELAQAMTVRGHEATVRERERSSSLSTGVLMAATSLRVVPKPFAHRSPAKTETFVEASFSANESERKVTVSSTNTMITFGDNVDSHGEYEIEALTADVVVGLVLQTLQDAFAGKR